MPRNNRKKDYEGKNNIKIIINNGKEETTRKKKRKYRKRTKSNKSYFDNDAKQKQPIVKQSKPPFSNYQFPSYIVQNPVQQPPIIIKPPPDKPPSNNNDLVEKLTKAQNDFQTANLNTIQTMKNDITSQLTNYINQGNFTLATGIIGSNNQIMNNINDRFNDLGNKINNSSERLMYSPIKPSTRIEVIDDFKQPDFNPEPAENPFEEIINNTKPNNPDVTVEDVEEEDLIKGIKWQCPYCSYGTNDHKRSNINRHIRTMHTSGDDLPGIKIRGNNTYQTYPKSDVEVAIKSLKPNV